MDGIANYFPSENALILGFCIYNLKTFPGVMLQTSAEASAALGPRHQFSLGSPAFLLELFYETTTGLYVRVSRTSLWLADLEMSSLRSFGSVNCDETLLKDCEGLCFYCVFAGRTEASWTSSTGLKSNDDFV